VKKRILWLGLSFLLVAALVLTSCGEAVPGEQEEEEEEEEITPTTLPAGMGIIKVYVTDPPRPELTSIEVVIDSIEVHKVVSGEPGEWISVEPVVLSFDLVTLVGVSEFLGSVEVTAGSFTQIRVGVSSVEVNGEPATLPSGTLKIVRPFSVREGSITTLELDFDGEKSVVVTGKGKFIFKPVVRLRAEVSGLPETGEDTTPPEITLEGVTEGQIVVSPDTVTPVFSVSDETDPDPTVTATLNGEPFTSGTVVSEVGEYELEVTATDTSGNETEVAVNFELVAE